MGNKICLNFNSDNRKYFSMKEHQDFVTKKQGFSEIQCKKECTRLSQDACIVLVFVDFSARGDRNAMQKWEMEGID